MSVELKSLVAEQAQIHQILSNSWRILIMWALENQEKSVGDIAATIGTTLQNTSQHLRLMKDKGLLEARREGQTIYYHIKDSELGMNCKLMLRTFTNPFQNHNHEEISNV